MRPAYAFIFVLEAKSAQAIAEAAHEAAQRKIADTRESLHKAVDQGRALEHRLAAEVATREATENRLRQVDQDVVRLQAALDEARREFSRELEKLRAAAQLADERFRAAEARALMEIDRERTAVTRLQKDLDQSRAAAAVASERHRQELAAAQADLGHLRQQTGVLEGNLQATTAASDGLSAELEVLRSRLTEAVSHASGFRVEMENWRRRAEEAQQTLSNLQSKAAKRPRKASSDAKDGKLL